MVQDCQRKRLIVLHLSLIDGVGPATNAHIVRNKPEHYSWDDLYSFSQADWIALGVVPKTAALISTGLADQRLLDQELSLINMHRIKWVTCYDDAYPALLNHINQPPSVLYSKGAGFDAHIKNVAIVGSRAADAYAQRVIEQFVPSLVSHGWSIVSGGAIGVDSMAHHATLAARGKTVAVLGSGLLRPYPRSNNKLFEQIADSGGTLVSGFALTVDPVAVNFPARNRIIAGLSSGCIVVQAAQKSGASITAQYALDQGRSVFAVPGMIDNPLSVGCHMLLQEGAMVAASIQDILTGLGESHAPAVNAAMKQLVIGQQDNVKIEKQERQMLVKETSIGSQLQPTVPAMSSLYAADSIESRIIVFCARPSSLDEVAQHCSLSCTDAQQLLFDLQLDGAIRQNFAGQWVCS